MKITASERMRLRPLGPDVLRCAERLAASFEDDGRAPASLWREMLETLHQQHADVMGTALGHLFTFAVLGRITAAGTGVGHPASGMGRRV